MEIRKIVMIGVVIAIFIAAFTPVDFVKLVKAANTITVTFDPKGNVSLDIHPTTWAIGDMWSYSEEGTTDNYFTLYNNGTVDMNTTIQITTSPANFDIDEAAYGIPVGDDDYHMRVRSGSGTSSQPWLRESAYDALDSDIDPWASDTFGLNLYISNITDNHSSQTIVITLLGTST